MRVTNGHGFLHLVRRNHDVPAADLGLGPEPLPVGSRHGKAPEDAVGARHGRDSGRVGALLRRHQTGTRMLEREAHLAALDLHVLVERPRHHEVLFAVHVAAGPERETVPDVELVLRMDVLGVSDVDRDGKSAFRDHRLCGDALRVADARIAVAAGGVGRLVGERSELNDVERELVSPRRAPAAGQRHELAGVLHALAAVGAALVPCGARDRELHDRRNHRVVLACPVAVFGELTHRREFARGLGLDDALRPRDDVRAVHIEPLGKRLQLGHRLESLLAHERLDAAARPVVVEDSHRDAGPLVELARHEVTLCGDAVERVFRGDLPLAAAGLAVHRKHSRLVVELDRADVGIALGLGFLLLAVEDAPAERHLRIGLPRDEPDVAHEHVLHNDRVLRALDDELLRRRAPFHRRELHFPAALGVGFGGQAAMPAEAHGHAFARSGRSPDRYGAVALEDHVVREYAVELNLREGGSRRKGE